MSVNTKYMAAGPLFAQGSFMSFWFPSILMGFGIAIDVTLATISQYRDKSLSFKNWTLPITCTHIGFPAIGFFLFWQLAERYPFLYPVLGTVGFLLVACFVYEVICESAGIEPVFGISEWFGGLIGFSPEDTRRIIKILAVSWDALWSGFAKEALVEMSNWSADLVIMSFVVAGLTVAAFAQGSLIFAKRMRKTDFTNARGMTKFTLRGKFVELSVIGGFGILAQLQGLADIESLSWIADDLHMNNVYVSVAIAAVILAVVFRKLRFRMMMNGHRESMEAVKESNDNEEVVVSA